MPRVDARAVEDGADLYALASERTTLDRHGNGPCPKCGGDDRFSVFKKARGGPFALWKCRKCHDKPAGAIDFLMWVDGLEFLEAVRRLTGEAEAPKAERRERATKPTAPARDPAVIEEMEKVARHSAKRLADEEGAAARAFLASRGISPETWRAFALGYSDRHGGSIAIPYFAPAGIVAVRYRAMADQPPKKEGGKPLRYFSYQGSSFAGAAFGLQTIRPPRAAALAVIEGEFNAMSVHQALRSGGPPPADVASLGSESADASAIKNLAARYPRVLIWTDRQERADLLREGLAHPNARTITSEGEEGKRDANDILRGEGAEALARLILSGLAAPQTPSGIPATEETSNPNRSEPESGEEAVERHVRALDSALRSPAWKDRSTDILDGARKATAEMLAMIATGPGSTRRNRLRVLELAGVVEIRDDGEPPTAYRVPGPGDLTGPELWRAIRDEFPLPVRTERREQETEPSRAARPERPEPSAAALPGMPEAGEQWRV